MNRRNAHVTLSREEADELVAGHMADAVKAKVAAAIGEAERFERAMETAQKMHEEGKLTPVDLSQEHPSSGDHLRVVWREPSGDERRCATYLPFPDDAPDLRDGLASAVPPFTVYTYQEAERMVKEQGDA